MTGNMLGNSAGRQETEEVLHIVFISTTGILIYLHAYCPRWLGKFKSKWKKCNMAKLNEQPWIPYKIRGWCSSWKATCCLPQSALPKPTAGIVGNALPQLPCGKRIQCWWMLCRHMEPRVHAEVVRMCCYTLSYALRWRLRGQLGFMRVY